MAKTYTVKEVKEALADLPGDAQIWGTMHGVILVEHSASWTGQKTITELLEEKQ